MVLTTELLVGWLLIGAVVGALIAPRNGWEPIQGAVIGGIFGLFGWLFLAVKRGN